jgi:uncharacterized protein
MADKRKQGFAAMDPERRREVARRGGQATHRLGKAHQFTPEQARAAGKKGGRAVSRDRTHTAKIGYRGAVSLRRQRGKCEPTCREASSVAGRSRSGRGEQSPYLLCPSVVGETAALSRP